MTENENTLGFFTRLWLAFIAFFQVLFNPSFARQVRQLTAGEPGSGEQPKASSDNGRTAGKTAPEEQHASGLFLLSMLQREGRFIDFLEEDLATFSDEEVGAAVRVVHTGCRKVLTEYLHLEPVLKDPEGANVTVPNGFDPVRIRLTGNVAGQPPYAGSLKHHGWVTKDVRLPPIPAALDPRVIAPAEVELS